MNPKSDIHFKMIFWFIVGLCTFGAGFSVFLILYLPAPAAARVADTTLIFWLSTAVSGGIGYLIGNSVQKGKDGSTSIGDNNQVTVSSPTPDTPVTN